MQLNGVGQEFTQTGSTQKDTRREGISNQSVANNRLKLRAKKPHSGDHVIGSVNRSERHHVFRVLIYMQCADTLYADLGASNSILLKGAWSLKI